MNDLLTEKTVSKFALEKEENLRIALSLGAVVPHIKSEIASTFFKRLRRKLEAKGWSTSDEIPNVFEEPAEFGIWKPGWGGAWERHCIDLDVEKRGREVFLGVWRNPKKLGKNPNAKFLKRFEECKLF